MPITENLNPIDAHEKPLYFGKSIPDLIDLELTQAYEYITEAEKKREAAKDHPKFNNSKKKLVLPPINPNFQSLKDAIINEMKKRNISYE